MDRTLCCADRNSPAILKPDAVPAPSQQSRRYRFPHMDEQLSTMSSTLQGLEGSNLVSTALEARLARLEELIGDLHEWMRSEQVASLPSGYRRLFSHLVSNDFDRRYAAQIAGSIFQSKGGREISDDEMRRSAIEEINDGMKYMEEALPRIRRREPGERPYVLALVGSSGAGKTTMMYKLAVRAVLNQGFRVKIISCDTYKIGSVEGVQTIADILKVPVGVAFDADEVRSLIEDSDSDIVILDTAGRSDRASRDELEGFIGAAVPDEIHLVLSSTMSARAIQDTAALFLGEKIDYITFTKLDEAPSLGSMLSSIHWIGLPVGYISTGTVIPDDLVPSRNANLGEWSVEGLPITDHKPEASHV